MTALMDTISTLPFKLAMGAVDLWSWQPFRRGLRHPARIQARLLQRILGSNAGTVFGRRYGFSRIRNYRDFRSAVPFSAYEDIRPLVMQQAETGGPVLTLEPSMFYARTSGTTGAPKLLPVTGTGFAALKRMQRLFALAQHRHAETFAGRILAIAGSPVEDRTPRGVPIGSASGAVYAAMPRTVRRRYVIPPEVLTIADYDARDYAIALLGIACDDLSALATANPSTLVRLRQVMFKHWDRLCDDVRRGRASLDGQIAPHQRAAIDRRLRPDSRRAAALGQLSALGDRIGLGDIWPGLKSVVTWTGGSCGYALGALGAHLPPAVRIIEAGYHASECRGTLNIDPRTNACVPALDTTFFEFVERGAWEEGGSGEFLTVEQLDTGRLYHVFVTTLDGLYRYDMNDIVRVTGKVDETPMLEFVQKGSGVTNITGEKLTEAQVLAAVMGALRREGAGAPFFLMLADEAEATYRLFIEAGRGETWQDASAVDALLMATNIEYAAKRRSGRLHPPTVTPLRAGAGDAYRRHCVARGQRDAQFKVKHLQYRREVDFDLGAWSAVEACR